MCARAALLVFTSACLLSSPVVAQNATPLGERVLKVYYNDLGAPPVVSEERVHAAAERAFQRWAPCGPRFVFAGRTDALPGVADGLNVIGWTRNRVISEISPLDLRGATQRWTADGRTIEFDIALVRWTVRTSLELEYVLVHELGHALGLPHSKRDSSIMFPVRQAADLDPKPSRADIEACLRLYAQ